MRIALIVLTALLVPSPKPNPKPQIPIAASNTQKPDSDHRGTQDDPLVVHIKGTEQSQQEAANNKDKDDRENKRKNYELLLTAMIAAAALAQVITAVAQASIYQKQSRLMAEGLQATQRQLEISEKSANAAMQGVTLQKAQLKQWVDIDEWKGHSEHFHPNATRTTYWLSFWITNPTKIPLTLTGALISVPNRGPVLRISSGVDYVISPENGYHVEWPTVVTDETMTALVKGEWAFTLVIDIDFVDAFGEGRHSQFTVGCKCRTTGCEVMEYHNRQSV